MGEVVLIMGESGSGKSSSLRNFNPEDVGVFSIAGKRLPFPNQMQVAFNTSYQQIEASLCRNGRKAYVIDDSQYLMTFTMFDQIGNKSYDKFSKMGKDFYDLVRCAQMQTSADTITYFLHHTEQLDTGKVKAKTVGKLLDNHLTLEGLFNIVLLARTDGTRYWFETQSDGNTTCKSPMGMFPGQIDNDLAEVDAVIRNYWHMQPLRKELDDCVLHMEQEG